MGQGDVATARARVVDGAVAAYRTTDFHRVGPAEVARHAGVEVDEVHLAFPVWELLVVAVVDRTVVGLRRGLWHVAEEAGAVAHVRALLEATGEDLALVRLRLAAVSAASAPDHPAAGWFRAQYERMYEDLTLALVRDVVAGREPRSMVPRLGAEQLLALYEGMQLQQLLREGADVLLAFDRAVARMRTGWATAVAV